MLKLMLCPVGVAGGHSGCEKQEGRVQGWLQAGVQQAAAGAREQVGGSPFYPWDTGQDTGLDGAGAARRPSLTLPCLSPRTLSCKGKEMENVFTIRTPEDANRVVRLARGRNVVIVGAGFLGER